MLRLIWMLQADLPALQEPCRRSLVFPFASGLVLTRPEFHSNDEFPRVIFVFLGSRGYRNRPALPFSISRLEETDSPPWDKTQFAFCASCSRGAQSYVAL
mmetsp:Transcript_73350/g.134271  ORF Transcript_73350/g.134271 Transcript_73350/m.134271 type:complete len:100 (+) Transcript_73350:529-828(+)